MPDSSEYPGAPRWVKVAGIIVLALVLVFAVVHISGHGIGDHMPSGTPHGQTPPGEGH